MADAPSADQELLRQLAKGNEAAFLSLYERYQGPLYRFVLHMSGNTATAEEVTQEVFMQLMKKPKGYEANKGSLAGYLFGIARNLARRTMQGSRLDEPIDDEKFDHESEAALASEFDVLAELSNAELIECLRRAVLALPEPYREVVALCDLEEMSYADAAALLECSPGTVASRLHRARAILKSKMSVKKQSWEKCAK
ncbi:MAG TPA: RNA polymerase sigma factor [Candidatus Angelobacter sp.]|nr:RNA polymerase sigma factor [Candidatus Angelobacter sp.]